MLSFFDLSLVWIVGDFEILEFESTIFKLGTYEVFGEENSQI
jgi:hypothetical protein